MIGNAEPQLHNIDFRAMGCQMGAWVVSEDAAHAEERLNLVRTWMALVERALSRFDPESEFCRLNRQPAQPVRVSPLLWDALGAALDAAQATDGLYDPTVLDALEAAGYDRDFAAVADSDLPAADVPLPRSTWREIERDPLTRSVVLPLGLRLDLGGIAKGWAAARAADMLTDLGPCLVNAGGDLAVHGTLPGLDGWPISVTAPDRDDALVAQLQVRDRGVATSGVDYRRWQRGGAEQHHVIDPATRRPAATDLRTATVVAPNATQADLYALLVMVLGRERGAALLTATPGLAGLLVDHTGRHWLTPGMADYISRQ